MKIGVITDCFKRTHAEAIKKAAELGLSGVQIYATTGSFSPDTLTEADKDDYRKLLGENGISVSALCADMGGYGFERAEDNLDRIQKTKDIIDLAVEFGTNVVTTHIGVIPDDKANPRYKVMLDALTECGIYAKEKGVTLAIETGPEKAKTLLAFLEDTKGGVGVNLDPANLIMYGRANPVDAVGIYGDKVRGVHLKDGNYPTGDFSKLGRETKVGEGSVNYPAFINKLVKEQGYAGDLYIEREISGAQQIADIKDTIVYIKELLK
jgi:sugar phosphate isomerase/epimerase